MKQKSSFLIDALHIFVLFSFALGQPLFSVLSRNTVFFVARRSEPKDIILVVLILCVLLPALFVLVEWMAGLFGWRVRKWVHGLVVAGLVAGIALPVLKKQLGGISGTVLLVGAALLGVVVTIAYIRFHPVRIFLTVLSPALLLFPALFLFNSPVFKVVFPENDSFAVTAKVDATAPVVMVVFDELSVTSLMDEHHQIDPIRYPNFAALARDAYWFRNATTVVENTEYAIPAILTGNYPDSSRLPTSSDYPHNLFTLLGGTYDLKVFETLTQLCPDQLCANSTSYESLVQRMKSLMLDVSIVYLNILLPPDLATGLPTIEGTWKDFAGTEKDAKQKKQSKAINDPALLFETYIESIHSSKHPTLYFLHISTLPHVPWKYLPSGREYGPPDLLYFPHGVVGETWSDDEWETIQGFQRYLLQVGFVDKLVGELIARLKAVNFYDRSLIVITADHGVSFRPGDKRRPLTQSNYQDILPVPLLIKVPDQHEAVVSDRNVETIDILPTIADILGITLPRPVDGHSAIDPSIPERSEKVGFRRKARERLVFEPDLDAKYDTLERQLALFGSGTKPDGLFRIGPHNELVGRRVGDVGMAQAGNHLVELEWPSAFENVNPEALFVPAHITGRVRTSRSTGLPLNLTVAVNGTIRAVTRTFPQDGSAEEFSAIVPETAFQAGKNDVEIFVVSEIEGQLRLHRTKNQSALYSLTSSTGESGETIKSSNGTFIRVIPGALQGFLDAGVVENDRVTFVGWAADVKNFQLPEAILIFVDGKFFYSRRTNVDRPDIVKAYENTAFQMAGFYYTLPLGSFRNVANSEVRVFALSKNGVASELNYPNGNQLNVKPQETFFGYLKLLVFKLKRRSNLLLVK